MKLQQLRYIYEVARHELNVSATAESLYTSQPGVSKQIRLLEDELGVQIFTRSGKHLTDITPAGRQILDVAARMLREAQTIKDIAKEYSQPTSGTLRIAAAPLIARYVLPPLLEKLAHDYPKVVIELRQGEEIQFAEWLRDGGVDMALTVRVPLHSEAIFLPCMRWRYAWLSRPGKKTPASLLVYSPDEALSENLRAQMPADKAAWRWAVQSCDAEMIKAYVRLEWGTGLIPGLAFDSISDSDLHVQAAAEGLPEGRLYLGFRRDLYWRRFSSAFAQSLATHFKPDWIQQIVHCRSQEEMLALISAENLPLR